MHASVGTTHGAEVVRASEWYCILKRRERRNGRVHASGGTTQGAKVVGAFEWVGARVRTGIAFSNLAEAAC